MTLSGFARIAVLDTGVSAAAGDVPLEAGWSAFSTDPSVDANGHGTWVASIAAARANNGQGIAGVAFDRTAVLPVQVLDANGLGQDSDIINGVLWAVGMEDPANPGPVRADVILMAFSNPGFSQALQDAIDIAWSKGAVIVAATGNGGSAEATFPAGSAKVVGVSGTDQNDAMWTNSNHGPSVFMAAPAVDITALSPAGGIVSFSGTSASAAMVAGAAALLKAQAADDPLVTNGVIVGRLARTAEPAATQEQTGNGRLSVARALLDVTTDGVTPAGAAGGPYLGPDPAPYVDPYVAAANNDAHVAPGWAPTNTTTTFSTLYRKTTGGTVQHVGSRCLPGIRTSASPRWHSRREPGARRSSIRRTGLLTSSSSRALDWLRTMLIGRGSMSPRRRRQGIKAAMPPTG